MSSRIITQTGWISTLMYHHKIRKNWLCVKTTKSDVFMIWNVLALKSRPNHKYWSIHKMRVIKKFSSLVPFGFENILVQRDHIFSSWFYQWITVSKIFYIPLMTELVVISVLKFSSSNELISTVTAPVNSGIWIWSCCEIEMIGPFSV